MCNSTGRSFKFKPLPYITSQKHDVALATGDALRHCPNAPEFAVQLRQAVCNDNGHLVSYALALAMAFKSGRIGVIHEENFAGRAIAKMLAIFCLTDDQRKFFAGLLGAERQKPMQLKPSSTLLATKAMMQSPKPK